MHRDALNKYILVISAYSYEITLTVQHPLVVSVENTVQDSSYTNATSYPRSTASYNSATLYAPSTCQQTKFPNAKMSDGIQGAFYVNCQ